MAKDKTSVKKTIAKAIRKADKRYFFEDYNKQAQAVIMALKAQGMAVVPLDPNDKMIEQGKKQLINGSIHPELLLKRIFKAMAG